MKDWNVVISVYQDGFRRALRALEQFGGVDRTPYYNVLVMKVDDPVALLETIERKTEQSTALYDAISRVAPAMQAIEFHSLQEFSDKLKAILLDWATRLYGCSVHVRIHRRGDGHAMRPADAERMFDELLLQATAAAGAPCKVSFTDPDAIIAIDTIDDRAGIALWTRADLGRHRLLRPG